MDIPQFSTAKGNNSNWTNFTILNENWLKLKNFLQYLVNKINNIEEINLSSLYDEILNKRILLNITISSFVSNVLNLTYKNVNYKITKDDLNKTYTIIKSGESLVLWDLSLNSVQVKNKDGVIIYPKIVPLNNQIVIMFDNIDESFSVLIS